MTGNTHEIGRTVLVCIDSFDSNVPSGRFYTPYLCAGVRFHGLTQFIKRMEQALDLADSLEPFDIGALPSGSCKTGSAATFAVRIMFRKNGSWQGFATWLDRRQEFSFKSALELVLILGDALELKEAG